MSFKRTAQFLRQLGTMLEAGSPVLRSLKTIAASFPGRLSGVATQLAQRVEGGATLHQAMEDHRDLLDSVELTVLKVGEQSGRLDLILIELAKRREAEIEIRKRIATRLIYPAIVLHLAILVGALVTAVRPGGSLGAGLLYLAKAVATVYGIGFGLRFAWKLRRRIPPYGRVVDTAAYYAPFIGRMVQRSCLIRFCQAFESMYVGGIAHPRALILAAEAAGNYVFENRLKQAVPMVEQGDELGESLQLSGAFDPDTVSKLITGIKSGRLEEALIAIRKEAEFDARTASDRLAVILPTILYIGVVVWAAIFVIAKFYIAYFARINEALGQ